MSYCLRNNLISIFFGLGLIFSEDTTNENIIPNLKLKMLDGSKTTIHELVKDGPIMIDFWATWCAPCVEEMPSLDKLQSLFRQEDLKIFTIATGRNNQKKISSFFEKHSISNLENFKDPKGELAIRLGVFGLPASILISPDGNEVARLIGPINWVQSDVINFFENLTP